jgi:hypothetical protein
VLAAVATAVFSGAAVAFAANSPARGPLPAFSDVTASAGLQYRQHVLQGPTSCVFLDCEPDRMTGGAAVGDVDGDDDLDLYVTRLDAPGILFVNRGNGTFSNGTSRAHLDSAMIQGNGAAFGDIDNDGDIDLLVVTLAGGVDGVNDRNHLFVNRRNGVFSEQAVARGVADQAAPRRLYSATFGDYDRDGWLDLHTSEWNPGQRSNSRLFHNRGAAAPGFFEDVTATAGVALERVHAFASAISDLDGDGSPDLAVAADFGTSQLFWGNGDGTFANGTQAAGVGSDENGMGSTFGDYDADGDLDWFVTSIYDPSATCTTESCNWGDTGNRLYRNDGGRVFSDATDEAGVRDGYWGWGAAFLDYDNDADLDLVMTNGARFPSTSLDRRYVGDPMRLWRNNGEGAMSEVSAGSGINDRRSGKGLVVFDYDADGDLDIFVVNNGGYPRLYRNNVGSQRSWLRVRAVGDASNADGIGARVTVQEDAGGPKQLREIGSVTHFLGQSESIAHFGLGDGRGPVASVEIVWPSGKTQLLTKVARNATLVVREPSS